MDLFCNLASCYRPSSASRGKRVYKNNAQVVRESECPCRHAASVLLLFLCIITIVPGCKLFLPVLYKIWSMAYFFGRPSFADLGCGCLFIVGAAMLPNAITIAGAIRKLRRINKRITQVNSDRNRSNVTHLLASASSSSELSSEPRFESSSAPSLVEVPSAADLD